MEHDGWKKDLARLTARWETLSAELEERQTETHGIRLADCVENRLWHVQRIHSSRMLKKIVQQGRSERKHRRRTLWGTLRIDFDARTKLAGLFQPSC